MDAGFNKRAALEDQLTENPTDEKAKTDLEQLDQLLDDINAGGDLNGQLIQKFIGADVLTNEMFIPDERDANVTDIASRTGMDIYSKKSRNPAMNYVYDNVSKLRNQPVWDAPAKTKGKTKVNDFSKLAAPSAQASVDKLAPGAKFIWLDGKEYTKEP